MTASGTWELDIDQPIGKSHAIVELNEDGGELTGTATIDNRPTASLYNGQVNGDNLSWRVDIATPFKMKIVFTLVRSGDTLNGTSKAGRWPSGKVTGKRLS